MIKSIILIFAIFIFFQINSIAQQSQVYKEYAVVTAFGLVTTGTTIRVDYGDGDIRMVDSTNNNQKIKSISKALNYMAKQGWTLVSTAGSVTQGSFFTFKRLKRKEE